MLREGWTEDENNAVSLRSFDKKTIADWHRIQIRAFGRNCVQELQVSIDMIREIYEARDEEVRFEGRRAWMDVGTLLSWRAF